MDAFDVKWEGPVPFIRVVEGNGFSDSFNSPGVYIWAVRVRGGYVAYYVGETGRPIRDRNIDHYKCYIHGEYRIYDPNSFSVGKKVEPPIWGDAYGFRWPLRVGEFIQRAPALLPIISQFVGLLDMFIIPFSEPSRIRKPLEAEVHRLCASTDGDLQDKDIKYQPTNSEEHSVLIRLWHPIPVAGLEGVDHIRLVAGEMPR